VPISHHLRELRAKVGSALLVLPSAAGVIRDAHGDVLLVRDASTERWVMPGGMVDPDETPADAVVREVWEETGLLVEPVALLGVYGGPEHQVRYGNGDRVSYVMTAFACDVVGGRLRPDGEEALEAAYVSPDGLRRLPRAPWLDALFADLFGGRPGPYFRPPTWRPED